MLTDAEQAAFDQSTSQVKKVMVPIIAAQARPEQAIGTLHRNIDSVNAQTSQLSPPVACRVGCAHCCHHRRVEVSTPEVHFIAAHLSVLSDEEKAALMTRLSNKVADTAHAQACGFLQDNQCMIYAVRPAVCRKAHSLSVDACVAKNADIPQHLSVIMGAEALIQGVNQAYEANGLSAQTQELNTAMLAMLTAEQAADTNEKND